jgi:hypothetical protein
MTIMNLSNLTTFDMIILQLSVIGFFEVVLKSFELILDLYYKIKLLHHRLILK